MSNETVDGTRRAFDTKLRKENLMRILTCIAILVMLVSLASCTTIGYVNPYEKALIKKRALFKANPCANCYKCSNCNGSGWVRTIFNYVTGQYERRYCNYCNGLGYIERH